MPTNGRKSPGILWLLGIGLGIAAVVTGGMWATLVKPSTVWSQEQAREFRAANDALHKARERPGASTGATQAPDVLAAQQRFQRINAELEAARYAHDRWGTWIAAGGVVLIVMCGVGLMSTREGRQSS